MGKKAPHITAAELKIMKILWRIGSGTVRDVLDALAADGESPAYTTVMTLMNQLGDKGAVSVDRRRQPFVYQPAVRREQVLGDRIAQFVQTVFDGQAGELVLRLVEQGNLSPEDLRRIEARIEARERLEGAKDAPPSPRKKGGKP
ncbi:MAG: BlaI/MecI/CopY family transcriptional regulator [Phycisphaerales bacterium]|nr:MAG: BlaI/MecI/CopY family transcriptional regulator [Phycisphaerales bacterium]